MKMYWVERVCPATGTIDQMTGEEGNVALFTSVGDASSMAHMWCQETGFSTEQVEVCIIDLPPTPPHIVNA